MKCRYLLLIAILALTAPLAFAATERGVMVRAAQIYLSPDASSPKIATIDRGREVAVLEKSRDWVHVLASIAEPTESTEGRDVSGWMLDKGIVRAATPNGDRIVFGEAVASEQEASRRGGRRGADKEAFRLSYRAAEYFPQSALAGEALYRAADIRWQIDRADIFGRPSGRGDPRSRLYGIDEDLMKQVIKKFPHTKWADLAAYHLLDNKLCGDWQGESKCPEKEAEVYEKYAEEHPQSPAAAEALFNAAFRRAALIDLYKYEGKSSHIPDAKAKAAALAQRVIANFPQSDWADRAQSLIYKLDQGIPTYGTAVE
jgi:outer membrane protein assembly factor BamD (BamD/ComL family)